MNSSKTYIDKHAVKQKDRQQARDSEKDKNWQRQGLPQKYGKKIDNNKN